MVELPGATLLKETESPALRGHQWSGAPQSSVRGRNLGTPAPPRCNVAWLDFPVGPMQVTAAAMSS